MGTADKNCEDVQAGPSSLGANSRRYILSCCGSYTEIFLFVNSNRESTEYPVHRSCLFSMVEVLLGSRASETVRPHAVTACTRTRQLCLLTVKRQ